MGRIDHINTALIIVVNPFWPTELTKAIPHLAERTEDMTIPVQRHDPAATHIDHPELSFPGDGETKGHGKIVEFIFSACGTKSGDQGAVFPVQDLDFMIFQISHVQHFVVHPKVYRPPVQLRSQ